MNWKSRRKFSKSTTVTSSRATASTTQAISSEWVKSIVYLWNSWRNIKFFASELPLLHCHHVSRYLKALCKNLKQSIFLLKLANLAPFFDRPDERNHSWERPRRSNAWWRMDCLQRCSIRGKHIVLPSPWHQPDQIQQMELRWDLFAGRGEPSIYGSRNSVYETLV